MCRPFTTAVEIRAKIWDKDRFRIRVRFKVRVSFNNNNLSAGELTDKYHPPLQQIAWQIFHHRNVVHLEYSQAGKDCVKDEQTAKMNR